MPYKAAGLTYIAGRSRSCVPGTSDPVPPGRTAATDPSPRRSAARGDGRSSSGFHAARFFRFMPIKKASGYGTPSSKLLILSLAAGSPPVGDCRSFLLLCSPSGAARQGRNPLCAQGPIRLDRRFLAGSKRLSLDTSLSIGAVMAVLASHLFLVDLAIFPTAKEDSQSNTLRNREVKTIRSGMTSTTLFPSPAAAATRVITFAYFRKV